MSRRAAWWLIAAVSAVALALTATFGVVAWAQYRERSAAASAAQLDEGPELTGARIVFRNTAAGDGYGHVAAVPLSDPGGARTISDPVCDRVDATATAMSCLRTERGIVPSYSATRYGAGGRVEATWPLTGIPSRTRLSPDGRLLATTSFVTGHSYATVGFSTATVIHDADGADLGNLEEWTLLVDGQVVAAADRNFWGVTFVDDSSFYATAGLTSSGQTYLVRGDIAARTLTAIADGVECPSLSPDGTRIAFKRVTAGQGPTVHWTPAVYDIATGQITLLPETRGIDDQIEWLDDATILYGVPRTDAVGDSDVWALAADGSGDPRVLIEHAWSPAVVAR
jgi:hypothetical protein